MTKPTLTIAAALGAALAAVPAELPAQSSNDRVSEIIVYGDDPCPRSTDDAIVVCARKPESERYRIPEQLRGIDDPRSDSWANRAIELQYVGRNGIGSCSPVGPGGQIGCFEQLVRQARAERGMTDEVNWNALIEKARQERLSRIDEEAGEVDEVQRPR